MTPHGDLIRMLAPELVIEIAGYLNTRDLGHFRQTCKKIKDILLHTFDREFFCIRHCMIEHESLEALVGIARHPRLARIVKQVHIHTHVFPQTTSRSSGAGALQFWMGRLKDDYLPRPILIGTGQAQAMLAEVFSNLPNLRSIRLQDFEDGHRVREGPDRPWRAWGWSYYPMLDPGSSGEYMPDLQPWVLLPIIFSALAQAQARPEIIEIILQENQQLPGYAFMIPRQFQVPGVFGGVRELTLSLAYRYEDLDLLRSTRRDKDTKAVLEAPLRSSICLFTSMELLRLEFSPFQPMASSFLGWLVSSADHTKSDLPPHLCIPPPSLTALSTLELGKLTIEVEELLAVSTRFNLTTLTLYGLGIMRQLPVTVDEDCWRMYITRLAKLLSTNTRLGSITFRCVGQSRGRLYRNDRAWEEVTWRSLSGKYKGDKTLEADRQDSIQYNSRETKESASAWLRRIVELIHIDWLVYSEPDYDLSDPYDQY